MTIAAWGFLAALVASTIAAAIFMARREGASSARLENEVDHAKTDKAAADVMAERRDPDAVADRMRRGDF